MESNYNPKATTLLAALCLEKGGELRISLASIRKVSEANALQYVNKDVNLETDEVVLRFGTKLSTVYLVEPEEWQTKTAQPQPVQPPMPQTLVDPNDPPKGKVGKPWTEDRLAKAEQVIRRKRVALAIQRERDASLPVEFGN